MKSVCRRQSSCTHELAVALDHIDAKQQKNLWMCFLFNVQGAVLMSLARHKVADAKRSEAETVTMDALAETKKIDLCTKGGSIEASLFLMFQSKSNT